MRSDSAVSGCFLVVFWLFSGGYRGKTDPAEERPPRSGSRPQLEACDCGRVGALRGVEGTSIQHLPVATFVGTDSLELSGRAQLVQVIAYG